MRYSELKRILKKAGCYIYREGSNHAIWYSPITDRKFTIGRHGGEEVATGTLKAILKDAGIEDLDRR